MDQASKSGDMLLDPKRIEEVLRTLVDTLTRMVTLEFLKQCQLEEIRMLFYGVWNVAYETKQR